MPPKDVNAVTPARSGATDMAVRMLRAGMRDGRYAPGQRLIEADLTRELGVSRGSLREALSRLAAEELVVLEPFRSATVRRVSVREARELFAVRELLEGEAARLAALRIGEADNRDRLDAALSGFERHLMNPEVGEYLEENSAFHALIMELGGNLVLRAMAARLHLQTINHQARHLISHEAIRRAILQHRALGERILAGDADGAREAMQEHVRTSAAEAIKHAETLERRQR